jgi:hydroxypyruvate reductase/glycerate 2-kinase
METVAEQIFLSGIQSALPDKLIRQQVEIVGNSIRIVDFNIQLADLKHIYVIGAGKASALMAKGIEEVLKGRISEGLVVVKYGHACNLEKIRVTEAAHPVPDWKGIQATRDLLRIARKAKEDDLVICLLSGGASSLLADYPEGSTLEDLILMNQLLLKSGADIKEMNTVRKHLSKVKGGQLAKAIYPARYASLLLSDVIGDPIDVIASGPTSPDASTFSEALHILGKYHLLKEFPTSMIAYLQQGLSNLVPETPKAGEVIFALGQNIIIGNNKIALEAAGRKAAEYGFQSYILTSELDGDLDKAANYVLESAFRIQNDPQRKKPVCLLAGGEPTIKVTEEGLGGRNQHFALYCATKLSVKKGLTILCGGTDGNDGPTDVAGAVVDCSTVKSALERGIDPLVYLKTFDSYHFFKLAGGHMITGSTMTNVMDLIVVLIE